VNVVKRWKRETAPRYKGEPMLRLPVIAAVAALPVLLVADAARADEHSIIKEYGDHPSYTFEAEPHGILGFGYGGRQFLPRSRGHAVEFLGVHALVGVR